MSQTPVPLRDTNAHNVTTPTTAEPNGCKCLGQESSDTNTTTITQPMEDGTSTIIFGPCLKTGRSIAPIACVTHETGRENILFFDYLKKMGPKDFKILMDFAQEYLLRGRMHEDLSTPAAEKCLLEFSEIGGHSYPVIQRLKTHLLNLWYNDDCSGSWVLATTGQLSDGSRHYPAKIARVDDGVLLKRYSIEIYEHHTR